ncbi:MAG: ribonuclease R [Deltaproteobacteria bacterium]
MPRLTDQLLLSVLRDAQGKLLGVQEIAARGGLHPGERTEVKRVLRELVRAGRVEKDAKRYRLPGAKGDVPQGPAPVRATTGPAPVRARGEDLLAGFRAPKSQGRKLGPRTVVGVLERKPQGFGFLVPLAGGEEDLFVPPGEARLAADGDLVRAEVGPLQRGRAAQNLEVIERRRTRALGVYRLRGREAVIEPLGGGMPELQVERSPLARDGQAVRVRLPTARFELGEVEAVLGDPATPGLETLQIAYENGFSDVFPEQALAEAARLPPEVTHEEKEGRRDLTSLPLVTIDGEDARDFDDAVCVEPARGGERLMVAIADVAHYVRPGSAIDAEALRRATSVYLPDRVLPMLPERLSNDLCSLVPGRERLCLVADMLIDDRGETVKTEVYPAVMKSHARCTYTQVAASLGGERVDLPAHVIERLPRMQRLSERLTAMRRARGAIDFNLAEAKVVLGPDGKVAEVARRPRNAAHRLVEEFMLAANEAVARHFAEKGLPTVYRVHDEPDEEKLSAFAMLARAHGFEIAAGEAIPATALDAFLKRLIGHPEERALNQLLLRAMMQAIYSAENLGHYGLGARFYLHFTSPIRRYPDLSVHRLLWEGWRGKTSSSATELEAVASRSSERERAAMQVERESQAYYGALLMLDHVGETFDGTIDAAASPGLFIELDRWLVTGLVPARDLGDDALLEQEQQRWRLPRSGRTFRIGGKVRVVVASVNVARRQIDLALAEPVVSPQTVRAAPRPERPSPPKRPQPGKRGAGEKKPARRNRRHGRR